MAEELITKSRFLSAEEAAEFLNLKLSTIYSKTSKNEIPYYRTGKKLMFDPKELEEWIRARRVKSSNEIMANAKQKIAELEKKGGDL